MCVSMKFMKSGTSGGRSAEITGSDHLSSDSVGVAVISPEHLSNSDVSAELVVRSMILWLNMAPRVQPAGVSSLDTPTCHTSAEQYDYSEGGGKEKKKKVSRCKSTSAFSRLCPGCAAVLMLILLV